MRTLLMALAGLAIAGLPLPVAAQTANNTAAEVSVLRPSANTLVYRAGSDGHFVVPGTANGAPVRFLVDTGATLVVLTPSDARAAGIGPSALVFEQGDAHRERHGAGRHDGVARRARRPHLDWRCARRCHRQRAAIGARHELSQPAQKL